MEIAGVRQRALLWGHLIVTLPALAAVGVVLFFREYLFVPGWPYYVSTGLALGYQWYTVAMPRWRTALRKRGCPEREIEEIAQKGWLVVPGASSAGHLALHTTVAGLCTTYVNLWLAGQLVHWILPWIGQPAPAHVMDFYLQHFETANLIPAFLLGCVIVRKVPELSAWAWLLPTIIIVYKLVTFVEPNTSVLISRDAWHRFTYYFKIQRIAPTMAITSTSFDVSGSDPVRVLQQITVVAPFYCGIAYSIGALAMKTRGFQRIWGSLSREPEPEVIGPEEADIVVIAADPEEESLQRK